MLQLQLAYISQLTACAWLVGAMLLVLQAVQWHAFCCKCFEVLPA